MKRNKEIFISSSRMDKYKIFISFCSEGATETRTDKEITKDKTIYYFRFMNTKYRPLPRNNKLHLRYIPTKETTTLNSRIKLISTRNVACEILNIFLHLITANYEWNHFRLLHFCYRP